MLVPPYPLNTQEIGVGPRVPAGPVIVVNVHQELVLSTLSDIAQNALNVLARLNENKSKFDPGHPPADR